MGEVSLETVAYAKIILHAAKYPYGAVNGVLLADATKIRDGVKQQDLDILDTVPLFHHSHNLSPMAEIALTQIESVAQADNRMIAGYYAACENFNDNTVEKCPGQKIAEKIVEYLPSAVFIVVDNKKLLDHFDNPAINIYKYSEGKWKLKETTSSLFQTPYVLETVSHLLERGVHRDLTDFDNYLDDITQDWTNLGIEKLIASVNITFSKNEGNEDSEGSDGSDVSGDSEGSDGNDHSEHSEDSDDSGESDEEEKAEKFLSDLPENEANER